MTAAEEPGQPERPPGQSEAPLLDVRDLSVRFRSRHGPVTAVASASFRVADGEIVGLVGESGCGKTSVARAVVRVLARGSQVGGQVRYQGTDVLTMSAPRLRAIRGPGIAMIFQDAMTAFNPVLRVGPQISQVLRAHTGLSRRGARERAIELLRQTGIPSPASRYDAYPHELSGGMRQRALIAMAISCNPRLLIADEPTTSLDVTIQAQILELILALKSELGMAVLVVSHDFGVVAGITDRVLVMYAGYVVEDGSAQDVLLAPAHPYSRNLIRSLVRMDTPVNARLRAIPGSPPRLAAAASSCPFAPRCEFRHDQCDAANPALFPVAEYPVAGGHRAACWLTAPSGQASRA
jgi:peptide/nickel transport system ATP-binding protein